MVFGISFWRAMPTSSNNRIGYLHGGSTSVAYNFNRYLGVVADFALRQHPADAFEPDRQPNSASRRQRLHIYVRPAPLLSQAFKIHSICTTASRRSIREQLVSLGCTGSYSCQPLVYDWGSPQWPAPVSTSELTISWLSAPFSRIPADAFHQPYVAERVERGWQNNARFSAGIVLRFCG